MPKCKQQESASNSIEVHTSPYFNCINKRENSDKLKKAETQKNYNPKKFGGLTEEDVLKLKLPDHLGHNLDILIVGINPGLTSAYKGHHYAGPNNHFWPCLYESGLIPETLGFQEDYKCPLYGIGLTNIVERTTRTSSHLSRSEIKEGASELIRKVQELRPKIVCFNGKAFTKQRSWAQVNTGLVCATGAAMFAKAISDEFKKYAQSSVNNKVTQEL